MKFQININNYNVIIQINIGLIYPVIQINSAEKRNIYLFLISGMEPYCPECR